MGDGTGLYNHPCPTDPSRAVQGRSFVVIAVAAVVVTVVC